MDTPDYNRKAWDSLVDKGDKWTQPVDADTIAAAKAGNWSIVVTPLRPVPRKWFPTDLEGMRILCLGSGGGQQGPVLAAAGASVTVFDNSPKQLAQDTSVARREGLSLTTELGDMRDLTRFPAQCFHVIVHPVSNIFVESPLDVWMECARVLKPGGALLSGFVNPLALIFDLQQWNEGRLQVRHRIPYADSRDLAPDELRQLILDRGEPLCYGHTLQDQIQGQIDAGFVIAGMYEDRAGSSPLDPYIDTFMATRGIRLPDE